MGEYELINHTADLGIAVKGESLSDLFKTAASAMLSQMLNLDDIKEDTSRSIQVQGENLEDLLVRWLNELLFLVSSGYISKNFDIEKITSHLISAKVYGEKINLARHPLNIEIKATTYHQLEVKKSNSHWQTMIIFDV